MSEQEAGRPWMILGTRGSPLALAQAHETRTRLAQAHGVGEDAIEIAVIRTTGDAIQDRSLAEAGGKGLFTKELDAALMDGSIDAAVHSSKDLPTILPDRIAIAGYLPREDVRDALISRHGGALADLPAGAVVGTASARRAALVLRDRPDIKIVLMRGNVQTRLGKLERGDVDATLLALAGLNRLGLADRATAVFDPVQFLPAAGQGAIAVTVREDDHATRVRFGRVFDAETGFALTAERAFLAVLDGSCRTPIAALAKVTGDELTLTGAVVRRNGRDYCELTESGPVSQAQEIGVRAGRAILARAPADILAD